MKVFIVVAVIIVTICLACLMKAKAEGDRIYDELAYKHFSSKEIELPTVAQLLWTNLKPLRYNFEKVPD